MGDYNAFKRNPGEIEMDAGSERPASTKEFSKLEAGPDDDGLETDYQPVNWKRLIFTPKYLVMWIILILIGVFTAVISLKHDEVVAALQPFAEKCRDITAGWLIFVAILFVISFPPLFGHEIVALLAGVVYGLWEGFGVVALGTFVGESEWAKALQKENAIRIGPRLTLFFAVQLERGSPSKRYFAKRQRKWREQTLITALWPKCAVTVDSGYALPLKTMD